MKPTWRERCLAHPELNFGNALRWARKRANKSNMKFQITLEEIKELFDLQEGKCFYSGIKMNIVKEDGSVTHDPFKMTIDRKDASLGYVPGNIVWCIYCVNVMKQKMSFEKMVTVCESICTRSSEVLGN
jgi:hypothetical protein